VKRSPVESERQAPRWLAVALVTLLLAACATPPEPTPATPPEPPPPPPSTVEVEPLKRHPPPQPVAGGPQQGEQQTKGEVETQEGSEASASAEAASSDATNTAEQKGGAQAANDMSKPQSASAASAVGESAAAADPASGATGQRPSLDGQLEQELSKFDEALLADQQNLALRREQAHADGGGIGGEDQWPEGYGEGGEDSGTRGTAGEDGDREEGEAQGQRGGIARTSERRADGTRREDIPDGRDDDIVARQLREAAERETDPELKAKLWEEYRDYKKSASRQAGS